MKKRVFYGSAACVLFVLEILIALFVRDAFVRPYGGDILVTVLLCCLMRVVLPDRVRYLVKSNMVYKLCKHMVYN